MNIENCKDRVTLIENCKGRVIIDEDIAYIGYPERLEENLLENFKGLGEYVDKIINKFKNGGMLDTDRIMIDLKIRQVMIQSLIQITKKDIHLLAKHIAPLEKALFNHIVFSGPPDEDLTHEINHRVSIIRDSLAAHLMIRETSGFLIMIKGD